MGSAVTRSVDAPAVDRTVLINQPEKGWDSLAFKLPTCDQDLRCERAVRAAVIDRPFKPVRPLCAGGRPSDDKGDTTHQSTACTSQRPPQAVQCWRRTLTSLFLFIFYFLFIDFIYSKKKPLQVHSGTPTTFS
jgi:hypothetical protein